MRFKQEKGENGPRTMDAHARERLFIYLFIYFSFFSSVIDEFTRLDGTIGIGAIAPIFTFKCGSCTAMLFFPPSPPFFSFPRRFRRPRRKFGQMTVKPDARER